MQKAAVPGVSLLAGLLFTCCLAQAQTSVIPQIVDGGAWQTTVALTNTSATQTVVSLAFFQNTTGGATSSWNLAFAENVQPQALVLQGGSTLLLHTTDPAGNTIVGWGQVSELDNAGAVVAYAVFTQRSAGALGVGTAPASAAVSRVLVPFDNSGSVVTSMAIANPTSSSVTNNVGIRTASATTQPTAITLPAQGHTSFDFPSQFGAAAVGGQSGLAEFYSPSGSFSILALRFQSGALTTSPVYAASGPPIIASANSGGGNTAGNISMAGFSISKETVSVAGTTMMSDAVGGQISSYTPAEWQIPFAAQQFGPCSVLDVTYPIGGKVPYSADSYLDAGTINFSGPNIPAGTTLVKSNLTGQGPFYYFSPTAGASLQPGGTYTISTSGGSQVGAFDVSATLPASFSVTGWDGLTSVNRANGLTLSWTGSGFGEVIISLTGSAETTSTIHEVTVACLVPASPATFAIPQEALALLPAVQTGTAGSIGQLVVTASPSIPGQATAVSSTSTELTPALVGGGQVNYGFFTPSIALIRSISIQ